MALEELELELLPGNPGIPLVLGEDYHWSMDVPALNACSQVCFCHGCYPNWKSWMDRGRQVADNEYLHSVVQQRIDRARDSGDADYNATADRMAAYLATLLKKPRPVCERN